MNQPELSIIIPVYNEDATIDRVVRRCLEVDLPVSREVIVVDDGSHDETQDILLRSLVESDNVRIYAHDRNAGKGVALRTGVANAHGRWVVVQDADLELDPRHIAGLIHPLLEGRADATFGCRFTDGSRWASSVQWLANRVFALVVRLLYGGTIRDIHTCYKACSRELLMRLELESDRFEIDPEITAKLLRSGARIEEVPIPFRARTRSEGKKLRWHDGFDALLRLWRLRRWEAAPFSRDLRMTRDVTRLR